MRKHANSLAVLVMVIFIVGTWFVVQQATSGQLLLRPTPNPASQAFADADVRRFFNRWFSSIKKDGDKVRFVYHPRIRFPPLGELPRAVPVGHIFRIPDRHGETRYSVSKIEFDGVVIKYNIDIPRRYLNPDYASSGSVNLKWK